MHIFDISFFDDETGENFELTKEVDGDHITNDLNVLVSVLKMIGYTDKTIEDFIGNTYFETPVISDEYLSAALQEAIDEYQVSRDVSDNRLDDLSDYPEM
jgi:hypothetical protein